MGSAGGSKTTTKTEQAPPQLLAEAKPGYEEASHFYRNILAAPPIFTGQRVAGMSGGQQEATKQAYDYFGTEQPYMTAAKNQVGRTAAGGYDYLNPEFMGYDPSSFEKTDYGGISSKYDYSPYQGIAGKYDYQPGSISGGGGGASAGGSFGGFEALPGKYEYTPETTKYGEYDANVVSPESKFDWTTGPQWSKMDDPEMQRQIAAASEPIMAQLTEQVMPGIRSSGTLAGQGATSTRGDVARQEAVEGFGRTVGSSVIAPLMMQQSQLEQDYSKAIQEMKRATDAGDADRATQASIAAETLQAQSHDVTNQINQKRAEADAANKGRYASDWMQQQNVGAGVQAQYADMGTRASIANMQDATDRAIAEAQNRLGYAGLDTGNRAEDARNRFSYANLDTGTQLAYDQMAQSGKFAYDQLNQQGRLSYDQLMQGAYGQERDRQLQAAGMAPEMDTATARRIAQLNTYGLQEQAQRQAELGAEREAWEEPIFRQSQAAQALFGASPVGPGSSETKQDVSNKRDWLGTIIQIAGIAASLAGGMAGSSETLKDDIVDLPDSEAIVNDVLSLEVKQWRYKWDNEGVKRMGPILEQSPDWLKATDKTINILSLVAALVLTVQSLNDRVEVLEKCSSK